MGRKEWTMVYPQQRQFGPPPPQDLPAELLNLYEEARAVAAVSARAGAAMVRVTLEKLINILEPARGNLTDKIGRLKARGLDQVVIDAMDVLRDAGNRGGAHPGELDLADDEQKVWQLFQLLLIIVQRLITDPKMIAALYDEVPQSVRDAIGRRDDRNG